MLRSMSQSHAAATAGGRSLCGPEEHGQQQHRDDGHASGNHEQRAIVDDPGGRIGPLGHHRREEVIRGDDADAEDQEIEQPLGAGAHILRECRIDEDVHGCEEEGVADAVQQLDGDDRGDAVGEEGEGQEARGVAEDADDHRGFPAEADQHVTEHEHGDDLGDLAEALHEHRDVCVDADALGEVVIDHHEVAVVDGAVDEGDDEEHEDGGDAEKLDCLAPC